MVIEVKPVEVDYDSLALRVFLKALELIGGPKKLFEFRNLTWVPSLMEASYAVVLKEKGMKSEDEIAEFLGSTKQTVRNMLSADPELVMQKLHGELASEVKVHMAGGLAKLAYREVEEKRESIPFIVSICRDYIPPFARIWTLEVLSLIKGMHFPISESERDELSERLSGVEIKGMMVSKLVGKISFPVKNPPELLHKLKEAAEGR